MKRITRRLIALYRVHNIRTDAERRFEGIMHNCCCVSKENNSLSFAIEKTGPFKHPTLSQIQRPDTVVLEEGKDCVIVKDGYCFRMEKEKI